MLAAPSSLEALPDAPRLAPPPARAAIDWTPFAQAVLLALLTVVCYLPAIRGAFLWDDDTMVTDNPLVKSAAGLGHIWFSTAPYDYFPLTYSSFWVEWPLWGNDPLGYHLVNLGLHLASAFLLWKVLAVLRVPGAWLGALFFAIHPVNVASVAWIAERKNTLSMVFCLAAALAYLRSESAVSRARAGLWYGAALLLFVLALLSKTSVVMLPCLLLLIAWWKRGAISRRDIARTAPFFVLSLFFGALTIWFQHHRAMSVEDNAHGDPLIVRLLTPGWAILFYLGKALLPLHLSMIYPHWHISAASALAYVPDLALAGMLLAAWMLRRRWGRGPAFALAAFALAVLPASGPVQMAFFKLSYVSDHLIYLSMTVATAAAAAVLGRWREMGGRHARAALAAMVLVAGLLFAGGLRRALDFSSPEQLWRSALKINPASAVAHNNLGLCFFERQDNLRAEKQFRRAIALEPSSGPALTNLADVLCRERRFPEATAAFNAALAAAPEAKTYNNFGVLLLEEGDVPGGRDAFHEAIRRDPFMASPHFNLYKAALGANDTEAAANELRACLAIDPNDTRSLIAFATLCLAHVPPVLGRGGPPPAVNMAISLAERACRLTGGADPRPLDVLAKALRAGGQQARAEDCARQAAAAADRLQGRTL